MPDDRPHFFAFYPRDFVSDLHVQAMSLEEVGAYILLLCAAAQADPPAHLPTDDATLARLARTTPDHWAAIKDRVLRPFTLTTGAAAPHCDRIMRNHYVQKRLLTELDKAANKIRKNRNSAVKAARHRWDNRGDADNLAGDRNATAMRPQCDRNANQSQSIKKKKEEEERQTPNPFLGGVEKPARRKRVSTKPDPLFDRFWAAYPLKAGKAAAAQAFAKLAADEPLLARLLAALEWQVKSERWTKEAGRYIPHASTWINGRRWEDEPPRAAAAPAKETIAEMARRVAAEVNANRKESANGNA